MQPYNSDESLAPGSGPPHHRVLHREPLFIPAFDEIRKAALAHTEQDLRSTYQEVEKINKRLQRVKTRPDAGLQDVTTQEVEDLQRQRTTLLNRLVELIPKFGITIHSLFPNFVEHERHG